MFGAPPFRAATVAFGRILIALLLSLSSAPVTAAPVLRDVDLRLSDDPADLATLARLRAASAGARARATSMQADMRAARRVLEHAVGGLDVIDSRETGGPEVLGPGQGRRVLTAPSDAPRERVVRDFLDANAPVYGLTRAQAAALVTDADYANPAGNLAWVRLQQRVHGRPVFRGELTLALTPAGEIVRSVGQIAGGLAQGEAPQVPAIPARLAVSIAAAGIGVHVPPADLAAVPATPGGDLVRFERGPFGDDVQAALLYFPLGDGALELAWSMVLWRDEAAYWCIVGAGSGELLWRRNITRHAPNTYRVYANDSPAPLSPGPANPTLGTQGASVPPSLVTVDSQVSTGDPWLAPGQASTDGNNVQAGVDRDGINGVDAAVPASAPGTFDYPFNPPPGNPPPGDDPIGLNSQRGAAINLFYLANVHHDRLYDLGFTEQARNFQNDNYGRGGVGSDRVSAEAQDTSGVGNANFSTPPDGMRPRLQMYLWTGPAPDRDSALDAELVFHELAHGTSSRLHANASGLGTNMSAGLGEGWSDFYALSLLSGATDPVHGIYPVGSYSSYLATSGYTGNTYYGNRRAPRAPIGYLGGADATRPGRPHNPHTFADIDATRFDIGDGAFDPGPFGSTTVDQVHNLGEIWSAALWEARANLVTRLGPLAGNQRMLQLVTDGMKLDPASPTFLQARDAILAADCAAYQGSSELDLWAGFAARGMGFGAQVTDAGTGENDTRVVEDFTGPVGANVPLKMGQVGVTNATCGALGRNPAPGETLLFEFSLKNPYCSVALGNIAVVTDGGGAVQVGTLPPGASTFVGVPYTVPPGASCGSTITARITVTSDAGSQARDHAVAVGGTLAGTPGACSACLLTIGGIVSGLAPGNTVTLRNNGGNDLVVGANGAFTFPTTLANGSAYLVDVVAQPTIPNQRCTVGNGTGILGGANVLNIAVSCVNVHPVGGTVSGLAAGATVVLRNNGGDDRVVTGNVAFAFPTEHAAGTPYAATVHAQPTNPTQVCSIVNGAGVVPSAAVTSIAVTCINSYRVGGTVSGLAAGNSVTLRNNGGDELVVAANGSFAFGARIPVSGTYAVTVHVQPTTPNQACEVANGAGIVGSAHVDTVSVTCTTLTYAIGGSVSGLAPGNFVVLVNNYVDDKTVSSPGGGFAFATRMADGSRYEVTVLVQPTLPNQVCLVFGGTGTVAGQDVGGVRVACDPNALFVDGFEP